MKEKVESLKLEVAKKLEETTCLREVNDIKVEYLGKKGPVQELTAHMKELSNEEKREFGMLLNNLKQDLTSNIDAKIKYYEEEELNKKLQEEVKEYLEDNNVEELADIVEVIYGILNSMDVSIEEFEKVRAEKVIKRGAFKKKIFLEEAE